VSAREASRSGEARAATLVVDFDGTITERDLLDEVALTFGDPGVYQEVDAALAEGRMTLHEVLRREYEPVRASLDEVVAWVREHARVRPGFRDLVALARERGWRLVVVSSGFRQLIEPVLEQEGLEELELVSNSVEADLSGWRPRFRDEEPCETCGEPCKRATIASLGEQSEVIYIGDGYSDRCAAELAGRVFARSSLAAYLQERGVAFDPFDDFRDVTARLRAGGRAP
jgi:2,3-diketo-5-methylthio-1-phosphopentane phosphatase